MSPVTRTFKRAPPRVGQPYQAARSARQGQPQATHLLAACSYSYQRPNKTARFYHSRLCLPNRRPGFVPVELRVSTAGCASRAKQATDEKKTKQAARIRRWPCGGSCARRRAGRNLAVLLVHASGVHLSVRPGHPTTTSHPPRAAATSNEPSLRQLATRPWPVESARTQRRTPDAATPPRDVKQG